VNLKFYLLEVGDKFYLPDQDEIMVKDDEDQATVLSTGARVLINPDDMVVGI